MKEKEVKIGSDTLHMMMTDRFRTTTIEVILRMPMKKEDITKRNLLATMLVEGTKNHPTKRELAMYSQDLYNANVSARCYRRGNYSNLVIQLTCLNERFTEPGMFEKSIALLGEVIFQPNIHENQFDDNVLNYMKEKAKKSILGVKESSRAYSTEKMLENMNHEAVFSYHDYGYVEDLDAIDGKELARFYKEVISHSYIDIYAIGDYDCYRFEEYIRKYLPITTFKKEELPFSLSYPKARKKVQIVEEEKEISQASLAIGCYLDEMEPFDLNYSLTLYNIILGSGPTSKFFQNIREKHSLAYTISSGTYKLDHLLIIKAGIDQENFEKAVRLVQEQMKDMEKGEFTDDDLEKAKQAYLTSLEEMEDSPRALIEANIAKNLLGLEDISSRGEQVRKVSKEDIQRVAKKVKMDTIFLLKGGTEHEED